MVAMGDISMGYTNAINGGIVISSTGSPSINSTYDVGQNAQLRAYAQLFSLIITSNFTNGTKTIAWPDITGTTHSMTVANFENLWAAANRYLDTVSVTYTALLNGGTATWPANTATIP